MFFYIRRSKNKEERRKDEKYSLLSLLYFTHKRRCAVEPERSGGEARSAGDHALIFHCHASRSISKITVTQQFFSFELTTMCYSWAHSAVRWNYWAKFTGKLLFLPRNI